MGPQGSEQNNNVRAKQNIVICVLITVSNLMIIALILNSRRLRSMSKYHIIASMSTANILGALIYFPLDTRLALGKDKLDNFDPLLIDLRGILHQFCTPTVLSISVVCLGVDSSMNWSHIMSLKRTVVTSLLGILIPWISGFISLLLSLFSHFSLYPTLVETSNSFAADYVLPVLTMSNISYDSIVDNDGKIQSNYEEEKPYDEDLERPTVLTLSVVLPLISVWGFIPLVMAFVTTTITVILKKTERRHTSYQPTHSSLPPTPHQGDMEALIMRPSVADTVVSTLVILALHIPFLVTHLYGLTCVTGCHCCLIMPVNRKVEVARWSVSFILPAVWILDGTFRNAFGIICGKVCIKGGF